MKRFLLMSLALLAYSSLTLSAQEQKHWTVGLSALHGSLADDEHAQSIGQGVLLPHLSVTISDLHGVWEYLPCCLLLRVETHKPCITLRQESFL